MIYNVKGKLTYTSPDFAVVECGGVGFKCFVSMTTLRELPSIGNEVNLYTYMSVKEDAIDLFGFFTLEELNAFKLLISVSGVGPKAAMSVLSALPPDRLSIAVSSGDAKSVQAANGVGKKIAERIVLELKDKMAGVSTKSSAVVEGIQSAKKGTNAGEAIEALVTLGYDRSDAAAVVGTLDKELSVESMIGQALRKLAANL